MAHGAFGARQANALEFKPILHMSEYLAQLDAQGLTKVYVQTTRNGLTHFSDFLRQNDILHPNDITRSHIISFYAWLNERVESGQWKKSTVVQTMKKARTWINWLFELEYIDSMPWVRIKLPTITKEPKPLEEHEVMALFAQHRRHAFQMDPFAFHRREMILVLLFAWGLRLNELAQLSVFQVDLRNDFCLVVNSKSGGKKTMPMTPEVKAAISRWMSQRVKHAKPEHTELLINTTGTPFAIPQIRTVVTDLGRDAGMAINPHRLRDTCATILLNDDVDPTRVQRVLGHTNLAMTMDYARVNDRTVYRDVTRTMDPRLRSLFRNTRELREPDGVR